MLDLGPGLPVTPTASKARTLGEMFWLRAARTATRPALYYHDLGRWRVLSWAELYERAARVANGLRALGVAPGERVAILGPTQPAWAIYDLGAQLAGAVSFGIYPKQSPEQVRYLLEHSEARVVFVADPEELETVLAAAGGAAHLTAIVPWTQDLFGASADRDRRITSPARFEAERLPESVIRETQASRDPDDTAIFIYTSGTTGPPKGAMISHRNILSLLTAAADATPFRTDDVSMHFLPMAHSAERVLGFYGRVSAGIPGAYARSTATVLEDLQHVRPTLFGSVPRIFEKAYAKIHSELEKKPPAVRRLFAWADAVGRRRVRYVLDGRRVPPRLAAQYAVADRLVFRKVRQAFGGRVRLMITGAAPTAPEILEFFWAAGLPIYEAYGMTESTVITHINREGAVRLGTVGRVIPPAVCRIAEDGEILVKSPWVFRGYYKNEEATAEAVEDGWLHTGDIGYIDDDGYLRITDRKKHLIITAGGKNISPANIEKAIKGEDPLISQVHAHGDRRNYVSALIAPSPLETLEWGVERGLVTREELAERQRELMESPASRSEALNRAMATVVAHPEFKERIREAVKRGNAHLARVEQVRRFVILDRDFSQEAGELTPTLKLKRKVVEQKYAALFDRIYREDGFAMEP
ncbi:MAG TPA: long-chain fatty acid--CoA ligase [Sandaracinaceae bacterium]